MYKSLNKKSQNNLLPKSLLASYCKNQARFKYTRYGNLCGVSNYVNLEILTGTDKLGKVEFSMYSEIIEQSQILKELAKKYLPLNSSVQNIHLNITKEELDNLSKVYIVASGSSRNVGNIAKYLIENIARLHVDVDYSSEFAHRNPCLKNNDLVIAVSQSGETADTYYALREAVDKGAHTLALTNCPESKINNLAKSSMHVGAGKERGIAATKSFTAQLINLFALAVFLGEQRGTISEEEAEELKEELHSALEKMDEFLENTDNITKLAQKIKDVSNLVIVGRSLSYAVAQEGALKIKETSYIDANGYPTGEFLHGYVAVLDNDIPVISIIVPNKKHEANYKLAIKQTLEMQQKGNSRLIIIKNSEDKAIEERFSEDVQYINIPSSCEEVSPFFTVVCLQLLALRIAEALGKDPDNPRGLTKAIVSE